MAALSIRGIDDDVKQRLRVRAAENGRSMEAEAREILERAVGDDGRPKNLAQALMEAAQRVGGVELDIPPRTDMPRAPDFGE